MKPTSFPPPVECHWPHCNMGGPCERVYRCDAMAVGPNISSEHYEEGPNKCSNTADTTVPAALNTTGVL